MYAVAAAIDRRCSNIHQFFGEGIQFARLDHDLFNTRPGSFEQRRLTGECPPEIVNKIRFASSAYFIRDCTNARIALDFFVGPNLYGGHNKDLSKVRQM
jgi:hypothetical protein